MTKIIENSHFGKIISIEAEGEAAIIEEKWNDQLYLPYKKEIMQSKTLNFIPYYSWGNRSLGEMKVWIDKKVTL